MKSHLAWFALCVGTFFIGAWWAPLPFPETTELAQHDVKIDDPANDVDAATQAVSDQQKLPEKSSTSLNTVPSIEQLLSLSTPTVGVSIGFARQLALMQYIERASPMELIDIVYAMQDDQGQTNYRLLGLLLSRVTETKPASLFALTQVEPDVSGNAAIATLATYYLSTQDPVLAVDVVAEKLPKIGQDRTEFAQWRHVVLRIFEHLTEQNPQIVGAAYERLADSHIAKMTAAFGVAERVAKSGNFRQWLDDESVAAQPILQRSLFIEWAKSAPAQAAAWFEAHPDIEDQRTYRYSLLTNYLKADGPAAAQWFLRTSEAQARVPDTDELLSNWTNINAREAFEWMMSQPNQDATDNARMYRFFRMAAVRDPQLVAENLSLLATEEQRIKVSEQAYRYLKQRSAKEAEVFLINSPYREQIRP